MLNEYRVRVSFLIATRLKDPNRAVEISAASLHNPRQDETIAVLKPFLQHVTSPPHELKTRRPPVV